ncbi:hypothetical protein ES702_05655 [subsurface metagenome]
MIPPEGVDLSWAPIAFYLLIPGKNLHPEDPRQLAVYVNCVGFFIPWWNPMSFEPKWYTRYPGAVGLFESYFCTESRMKGFMSEVFVDIRSTSLLARECCPPQYLYEILGTEGVPD